MDLQITATYPLFSRYQCMKYQSSTVFSWMVYMWYMYWQYAKCTVFSNPWNHGWTLNFNYWVLNLLYIWIILHEGNLILTVYYFENNNKTLISCFEPLNNIKFQVSFFFRSPCWLSVHLPSYLLHSYFTFLTLRTTQPISIKLATSFLETKEQKVAELLHIIKVH